MVSFSPCLRIECIDKIKQRQADFGTVDPEDMYIAGNVPGQDFAVFEEIRTREEPEGKSQKVSFYYKTGYTG